MTVAYAFDCMCCVWEFRDEILLRGGGGECKTREKLNFSEKWQNSNFSLQYRLKIWKFSRYRMMKQTSPLDSSYPDEFH